MSGRIHVIGAGVAGLAAAVRLAAEGRPVCVYEAAPRAGGRCRSYDDPVLGRRIDNGNHLILSGNASIHAYAREIGSHDAFWSPDRAVFDFVDLRSQERWSVRPNAGPVPWWALAPDRRPPGTRLIDLVRATPLAFVGRDASVADLVGEKGLFFERFWEPLTIAALNTTPEKGQARLLWTVLWETFLRGEAACRPMIAREGLGPALIDPALATLARLGAHVRLGARVRELDIAGDRVAGLRIGDDREPIEPADQVVLATPPARAAELVPGLSVPGDGDPIVNVHYRLAAPPPLDTPWFIGLLNAVTHWAFVRDDVVSVTISAATREAEMDKDALADTVWNEVRAALKLPDAKPAAVRVVTEKRATFDQSPQSVGHRPATETALGNLVLAGDWVDTGLPATLESAARSGHMAAAACARRLARSEDARAPAAAAE